MSLSPIALLAHAKDYIPPDYFTSSPRERYCSKSANDTEVFCEATRKVVQLCESLVSGFSSKVSDEMEKLIDE